MVCTALRLEPSFQLSGGDFRPLRGLLKAHAAFAHHAAAQCIFWKVMMLGVAASRR
jgi:hypothetical protein